MKQRAISNFTLSLLISALLIAILFGIDYLDGTQAGHHNPFSYPSILAFYRFTWAPIASVFVILISFGLAIIDLAWSYTKMKSQN